MDRHEDVVDFKIHHDLDNDGQSLPKDNVVLDKVDNRSSNGDNVDNVVDTVADNIVDNVVEEPSNGQNVVLQPSIDDEVLARQKKLDKGKGVMTKEDTVKNKKQKSVPRGNGISIRENEGPLSSDNDSDEFENCVDYGQYSSESEGNGEGISYPFVMVEKQDEKYPIHDDQTHWRLKKPVALRSFKIAIVGDLGTAGAEYSMDFNSNLGGIRFMCSDKDTKLLRRALNWREFIIGEKKIPCALEGSHGSIIMFDENSPTYSEVPELILKICRFCGNIPIVLCRNRVDLRHIVNARQLMQLPGNIKYCEISAPSNYNIERPFLLLAMMLVSPSISFMEEMAHPVPALEAQDSPSISFMEEMAHLVPPQDLPNQQIADNPSFKIAILGPAGAGKTTFVERRVDGDNNKFDDPDTGVRVYQMDFGTDLGPIRFNCWVPTGLPRGLFLNWQEYDIWKKETLGAHKGAHGAIIMFDVNEESPYDHVNNFIRDIERFCGKIPIVLCGNKVDLQNRNVNAELLAGLLDGNTQYCEISALSNYNFEKPFLYLARRLCNDEFIWFREPPALVPAEFEIDLQAQRRNEDEFFGALYRAPNRAHNRAYDQANLKLKVMRFVKQLLKERRNLDPDSPLPDHDDELMRIVKVMMMRCIYV